MNYLPAIIIGILAFGMGLASAAMFPSPFATLYGYTTRILAFIAAVIAVVTSMKGLS